MSVVVDTRNYWRSGHSVLCVWSTKSGTVSVITTQFYLIWSLLMKDTGTEQAFAVIFGQWGTKCFSYSKFWQKISCVVLFYDFLSFHCITLRDQSARNIESPVHRRSHDFVWGCTFFLEKVYSSPLKHSPKLLN